MTALAWAWWASTSALGGMVGILAWNLRSAPRLERPPGPVTSKLPPAAGRLSALVPARDEAANLAVLLPLLAAGHPLEILVLDDHSSDGGADAARELARSTGAPIRVLPGAPLPPGWLGKNWACAQLARAARGDLFLFCDADVRPDPRALGATAAWLGGNDLVTALPRQAQGTWAERALVPLVMHLAVLGFLPLPLVPRHPHPGLSLGVGQWLAFRREAYAALGGHAAVRLRVAEDMALARLAKARGLRLAVTLAPRWLETRMYRNFREVWEGFGKILFTLTGRSPAGLAMALAGLAVILVMPIAMPLAGARAWWLPLGLLALGRLLVARLYGEPWTRLAYLPLGALLLPAVVARSWFGARTGTLRWKGRALPAGAGTDAAGPGTAGEVYDQIHG